MSSLVSQSRSALKQFVRRYEATIWLVLIIGVAAYLRFRGLTFQSYWYDELFSAHISNPAHSFKTVVDLTLADVHPPVYQLMMWLSYQAYGYTEWAGRLPSAIVGVLAIPVIYLLGRDLFNTRTGLYAAALATPNYYLLYFAQEARSYAFLYFLTSLSFLFFLRALRSRSRLNLTLYIITTLTLLYTQYFGFIIVMAQGVLVVAYVRVMGWPNRPLLTRATIAVGVIGIGIAPLIPVIVGHSAIDEFWIRQPGPWFLATYFPAYFQSAAVAAVILILLCITMSRLFLQRQWSWERYGILLLLIWVAAGYLLPWLRGFLSQPVLTDRNTIMLVPPILVLAAYGIVLIPKLWIQRVIGVSLITYSFYILIFSLDYYERIRKDQFRETAQAMSAFEPLLPVYTLKFNDAKYNVYFTQQGSSLVAKDASELEFLLADHIAPPLFWLADALGYTLQTDIDERYGLIEVGRYRLKGTIAVLLINPAAATRLTLQPGEGMPGGQNMVYTSASLPGHDADLQLLVTVNEDDRPEFNGEIYIELLASDGRIVRSHRVKPGPAPAMLMLDHHRKPFGHGLRYPPVHLSLMPG